MPGSQAGAFRGPHVQAVSGDGVDAAAYSFQLDRDPAIIILIAGVVRPLVLLPDLVGGEAVEVRGGVGPVRVSAMVASPPRAFGHGRGIAEVSMPSPRCG